MTVQLRHCVRAAQRGDTLAMEEVIREFDPFLCKLAKAYQEEYQDYYQSFVKPFLRRIRGPFSAFLSMI